MSTETTKTTTGAGHGSAEDAAACARARIDDLDARIIALVQERRGVSADIERARVDTGGRPADGASRSAARSASHGGLAREMEILDRYRGELGRHGTQLAMTLLTLCRAKL
jgi:chorismate mutase